MPSSVIKSHWYLQDVETLVITFVSGKVYEYFNVSKTAYEAFRSAYSKGIHFNKYIKPCHPFKEILS